MGKRDVNGKNFTNFIYVRDFINMHATDSSDV